MEKETMEGIYIEKDNSIAYFIESYKEDDFVEINNSAILIKKSAFVHSEVKKILFKNCSTNIGEKAFENCESLTTVIFGKLGKDKETMLDKETAILKNLLLASTDGNYTIQSNAFKGCRKLTTLILPKLDGEHKLVIEKDAFCDCDCMRTVVAICDEIDFTGNPFAEMSERLTFVCKKDSGVARFARENGYRSVYVDESV